MSEQLPFSQACENNKGYILDILKNHLRTSAHVLEIGGGTGQHAVHFATHLPWLSWHSSDLSNNIEGLNRVITHAQLNNLPLARVIDVTQANWNCDAAIKHVFTANTLHIMSAESVKAFFSGLSQVLTPGSHVFVYGPFKYGGEFTTDSNANFERWLKSRDPLSGIRDFETIDKYANEAGLTLLDDNAMPANNQLLVWHKPVIAD
jgi:cyclopropane fatty-acyl-phospholipid synthase-like methyltransferase